MSVLENILPDKYQADEETKKERKAQCDSCHFRKSQTGSCGKLLIKQKVVYNGKTYKLCGCLTNEKIIVKSEKCPLGKW